MVNHSARKFSAWHDYQFNFQYRLFLNKPEECIALGLEIAILLKTINRLRKSQGAALFEVELCCGRGEVDTTAHGGGDTLSLQAGGSLYDFCHALARLPEKGVFVNEALYKRIADKAQVREETTLQYKGKERPIYYIQKISFEKEERPLSLAIL